MATIPPQLIGESQEFHALLDWVSDIATINKPILILGEAGTGKEQIASRLHFLSPRWEQSYHMINCAAHDAETFEGIMYGNDNQDALFTRAHDGTLFLENINALTPAAQERLLHVIEYSEFDAFDGLGEQSIDIRFIASISENPAQAVDHGQIRADFLNRIAFDVVHIPPLRLRKDDIAPLTLHYGRKMVSSLGAERFPGLTPEAMNILIAYDWPNNSRELKSVIERSVTRAYLADETLSGPISTIELNPLKSPWGNNIPTTTTVNTRNAPENTEPQSAPTTDFTERVITFERGLIDEALTTHNHHQGKAADYLGLTYHSFRGLLRKHGMKK